MTLTSRGCLQTAGDHALLSRLDNSHGPIPCCSCCAADVDSAANEEVEAIAQQAVDLILPAASPPLSAALQEDAPAAGNTSRGSANSSAGSPVAGNSNSSSKGSSGGGGQGAEPQPVVQMEVDGQAVATEQRGMAGGTLNGATGSETS